ncbi:MAG: hypothetical protein COA88_14170 [Kordia sp.]|nr:MAG: hypothetical protein COA88_14170 [Kordia sp.]
MDKQENHLVKILQSYLKKEGYALNQDDFKLQLLSNPSYPSVKSITDALDYFNIENVAANVPKDALIQLPNFFIGVLETSIAQVEQKKNSIKLFNIDGTKETISIEEFKKSWNGTLIAIEKNTSSASESLPWLSSPITLLILLTLIALTTSVINVNVSAVLFSLLTSSGIWLSYFIVQENLGVYNRATSKICNSAKQNTNCSDVINSKTSKIFNLLSLSDISIVYFVGSLLLLIISGFQASFYMLLSLVSIPVVLYSVYLQAFQIKKWCPLCLGIASILIGQGVITGISFVDIQITTTYYSIALIIYVTTYLIWFNAKRLLSNTLLLKQTKTDFLKFKRNEGLFTELLGKKNINRNIELCKQHQITFGNPNATLVINAVTNPLCGFCSTSFKVYEQLLKTHGNLIKLNLIFNVDSDLAKNEASQISQQLILLYRNSPENCFMALQEWFTNKDIISWQKMYGKPVHSNIETLYQHLNWCELNDISYTPATLIGKQFFPKEYNIEDLPLFIDYLIEESKLNIQPANQELVRL